MEYEGDKTNLIRRLGLECSSSSQIGLIGSMYFIGVIVGALVIPSLSDKYGRKLMILVSNAIHLIAVGGILFSSSLFSLYLSFFALGSKATGAMHITYIYMNEVVRKDKRAIYSTLACLMDCCNTLALPLYYYSFSDYIPLFIGNISLVLFLSALTIFLIPESPRYLLVQ